MYTNNSESVQNKRELKELRRWPDKACEARRAQFVESSNQSPKSVHNPIKISKLSVIEVRSWADRPHIESCYSCGQSLDFRIQTDFLDRSVRESISCAHCHPQGIVRIYSLH